MAALERALSARGLRLQIDELRKQILILKRERPPEPGAVLRGEVIDDEHGTRLPFATVSWQANGRLHGTAANEAGAFFLRIVPEEAGGRYLELTASYVGFTPKRVRVDLRQLPHTLPIRLAPETRFGPELVVSTAYLQTQVDTALHHLVRPGVFSSLGETGVVRSLQSLPAVSLTPAVSPGLNVRGSRADGFQILLDGLAVYNQNHFFGLFDAFNKDVLQAVALYYGITPAPLQGPSGGTLSFVTRTGSQSRARGRAGVSNVAAKATIEGPLLEGRGSWLLSGRRSYLNALDWLNNAGLIALGLDVGRETEVPAGTSPAPRERALVPGEALADFYDVHGKLFHEGSGGRRVSINAYGGGDRTAHDAERLVQAGAQRGPIPQRVETRNAWNNQLAGLRVQLPHGARSLSETTLGVSRYASRFSKDDYVYTDPTAGGTPLPDTARHLVRPFENDNELVELKLAQQVDLALARGELTAGYALQRFQIDYAEASIFRTSYAERRSSTEMDLFLAYGGELGERLAMEAGIRSHYFSLGRFLRLSPRLHLHGPIFGPVSASAAYGRAYQFLHRLYLEQSTTADIWIMSTPTQPPGSVDHWTAGLVARPSPDLLLQAEGYLKNYRNLREHETRAVRRRIRDHSPLLDPWLHDNEGKARGLEFMVQAHAGPVIWTNGYTLSTMEIQNDLLNEGEPFDADWDRRHQFVTSCQAVVVPGVLVHVTWVLASGTPNALAGHDPSEPERLRRYHRLDAGMMVRREIGGMSVEVTAAAFNLYDRRNTWYRSPISVVTSSPRGRRVEFLNADVYDLGFQPSFELSIAF